MRILLDEDVPHKLIRFLVGHTVETVVSMQWGGVRNGKLLALIEELGFDVFITGDKSMQTQQRLHGRPFAVLILSAINWPVVERHAQRIVNSVESAKAGDVVRVDCGSFSH